MTNENFELALLGTDGAWDLIDDYPSWEEAVQGARDHARLTQIKPGDPLVFGVSKDPGSGHYEERIEIDHEGNLTVK